MSAAADPSLCLDSELKSTPPSASSTGCTMAVDFPLFPATISLNNSAMPDQQQRHTHSGPPVTQRLHLAKHCTGAPSAAWHGARRRCPLVVCLPRKAQQRVCFLMARALLSMTTVSTNERCERARCIGAQPKFRMPPLVVAEWPGSSSQSPGTRARMDGEQWAGSSRSSPTGCASKTFISSTSRRPVPGCSPRLATSHASATSSTTRPCHSPAATPVQGSSSLESWRWTSSHSTGASGFRTIDAHLSWQRLSTSCCRCHQNLASWCQLSNS